MSTSQKDASYTDIKNWFYWGLGIGSIIFTLGAFGLMKNVSTGVSFILLASGIWLLISAFLHSKNGAKALITLKDDGVLFPQEDLFIPYSNIEKVWAGATPMGALNIVLHLYKDAELIQTKRSVQYSFRSLFFLTTVGCNISLIGKKKMVSLMSPGLRQLNASKKDQVDVVDELYARIEAFEDARQ
jgi:hypothetical protein